MKVRKIVMLATLIAVISGGELSAQAKTRMLSKITHVKVTKHRVTGYTTKYAHLKLTGLKHHEKASAKANKHGKFVIKVKKNNLKKLNFKIKATKKGYKTLTYKYKTVKKTTSNKVKSSKQLGKEHMTVENINNTVSSNITTSSNVSTPTKPSGYMKTKAELIKEKHNQLTEAKRAYYMIKNDSQKDIESYNSLMHQIDEALVEVNQAIKAQSTSTSSNSEELQKAVNDAQSKYDALTSGNTYKEIINRQKIIQKKLSAAEDKISSIADELHMLEPEKPFEGAYMN
ncbi:hypothetical protein [Levilactobacillus tujiorum]|uniref:Bacterial Ig domain-containing protein n=1 Tax=Levilactobacillus tujiorum TaxID=2912243 RepID=A0ABX1L671_9LACO|nr:hypothetical protein [Levilactobacillus tujiorum]MCH5465186.1 hypothetical protein [Levilactobacillus tujiorum]NLR12190.1 hypothetical protein [Lactobacillus sp. HBUAS51387]NLR30153.1 hypothetical protein [Levilactobacillus tujiorum]